MISGTDFHMHVHSPANPEDDLQFNSQRALFAAESIDLKRALILPNSYSKGLTEDYAKAENNFAQREAAKLPNRLAAACAVNPAEPWAIREIKRCRTIGIRVLKLHLMAAGIDLKKPADYKVTQTFLKQASELGFTVLVHANYPAQHRADEIEKLRSLIEEFPEIRWIIGHLFGREHATLRLLKHPNFFVEISVAPIWANTTSEKAELLKTIRTVGIEHFVFGSDWPVLHPAETLKYLKQLGLSENELNAILFNNAARLNDLFN